MHLLHLNTFLFGRNLIMWTTSVYVLHELDVWYACVTSRTFSGLLLVQQTFNVFKGKADENNIYVADAVALFRQKKSHNPVRVFIRSDLTQLPDRINVDRHWWPLHSRLINGHRYLPLLDGLSYVMPSSPLLSQHPQVPVSVARFTNDEV